MRYSVTNTDGYGNRNCDSYSHVYTDGNGDSHVYTDCDSYGYRYSNGGANTCSSQRTKSH